MTLTHGFELVKEQEIPELRTKARLYRHAKTGAELLSLENEDDNKVFGITFRTPPSDSTGVAHIMEHSVLCGSRKYPVKEPFVELMKGSLNTFLNAMTFPDKTCYPVASANLQDFYNLVDVYLDAVFYPLISPYTLKQEGWHYEIDDVSQPLSYKGVVYNEMKGAYSSPDDLLDEKATQSLYPDNTYGFDSGGNPQVIPDLTYEQFKRFHDTLYHPSNARIFFYGNDDPVERLRLFDEYLKDFNPLQVHSEIPLQARFSEPKQIVHPYQVEEGSEDQKSYVTVNWLLPEAGDEQVTLGLGILEHILIGTPASPLRKALIESGLGEDLAGRGLDEARRQMLFSTGLKGIQPGTAGLVEEVIFNTLKGLADEGIDPETVAASMNTVEFRLRENNTGAYPRGLLLMLRSLSAWLYGDDPIAPLAFEQPLSAIKQKVQTGHKLKNGESLKPGQQLLAHEKYFENLIREHFLENPHRTTVILEPDPQLGERREAEPRSKLDQVRSSLGEAELRKVLEDSQELKRRQDTPDSPEALATIPTLKRADLDKQVKRVPVEMSEMHGSRVLTHDLFTNGILYLDLGFDLYNLPQELLPYVPLFGRALLETGTAKEDFVRLSQRIGINTGGIRPSLFTTAVRGNDAGAAWLFLRGKSTVAQAQAMLSILKDVLETARLDQHERFRQIVLETKAEREAGLVPAGHRVVNQRLRAHYTLADWASEQMGGVESIFFLRHLLEQIDRDWPSVQRSLEQIRQALLNRQSMIFNVTVDDESWTQVRPLLADFVAGLPSQSPARKAWTPARLPAYEGLTLPAQVNYVAKGANLYELGYEPHGSMQVAQTVLRSTWLWEKVRVQGGAYGGFCSFDRTSGVFTYLSYRDPNLLDTIGVYDRTGEFLRQLDLPEAELTRTVVGTIGDLDPYMLPDAQGFASLTRFLAGITDEERQVWRDQVLSASLADLHQLGEALDAVKQAGHWVVLGSQDSIQAANQELAQRESQPKELKVVKIL